MSSFEEADEVLLAHPHRMDKIPIEEQLDVETIVSSLKQQGKSGNSFKEVSALIQYLLQHAQPHDVILIMSNGKFGNIHQRLLDQL